MKQNTDPLAAWKWSVGVIYFVAAMNVLIGWFANSNASGRVGDFQFNGSMLFGAGILYLILAICANNRMAAALWTAVVLFSLDAVAMVLMTAGAGHFSLWGLWLRIALIVTMYRGIPALAQLRQPDGASTAPITPAQAAPQLTVTFTQTPAATPQQPTTFSQMPRAAPHQSQAMPQRIQDIPMHIPEVPRLGGYDLPR